MSLRLSSNSGLERGEFRIDLPIPEVKGGELLAEKDMILLFKGWLGNLAEAWMACGISRHHDEKGHTVLVSFNEQDLGENYEEIVPD